MSLAPGGIAQFQKGSIQEAIAGLEKTLAFSPWYSPAVGYLAAVHVRAGNRDHAARLIAEFRERNPKGYERNSTRRPRKPGA